MSGLVWRACSVDWVRESKGPTGCRGVLQRSALCVIGLWDEDQDQRALRPDERQVERLAGELS
jgi:hypothetical protein